MDSAEQPRRLLGLLMIEMGLISEEQLVQALEVQQRTGERLGEVAIGLGFATRLAIQDALAKQSGVLLKPDAGFGGGLRGELIRRESRRGPSVGETGSHGTDEPEVQLEITWLELELKQELGRLSAEVERHAQKLEDLEGEIEKARHALTTTRPGTPHRNLQAIPVGADEAHLVDDRPEPFLTIVGRARKHITARRAALQQPSALATRP